MTSTRAPEPVSSAARPRARIAIGVIVGLLGLGCSPDPTEITPDAVLAGASSAMGADGPLAEVGPFALFASGTLDKAAEGQSFAPGTSSPGPFNETIGLDASGSGALWDYHEVRYDGTSERYGESYSSPDRQILLIHQVGIALPRTGARVAADRLGVRRRFPHEVVTELLERPGGLRLLGVSEGAWRIEGRLSSEEPVTLTVDTTTSFVRELSYDMVVPGRGPVTIRWWFGSYEEAFPGVWIPMEYGSEVGGLEYTSLRVDSARASDHRLFEPPEALRLLDARARPDSVEVEPLEVRELAPGLHVVPEVRGGFAPLVAEFDTFLVVVDAPASFPLLGQIPASETDPAPTMSWHSERLVDLLDRTWPEKPITYLVLTHHHEDHVGGVRAFVAAGATVLGPRGALQVAERLAAMPGDSIPDRLAEAPRAFVSELVDEPRRISDGARTIDLVPMPGNPHADGLLAISAPEHGLMFVSDIVTPASVDTYPAPSHAPLDRFFASWLETSGLDPDEVWSMHSDRPLTREHLRVLGNR